MICFISWSQIIIIAGMMAVIFKKPTMKLDTLEGNNLGKDEEYVPQAGDVIESSKKHNLASSWYCMWVNGVGL